MPVLPADVMTLLVCFAPVFSTRVWRHIPLLVVGAILAPGQRTVAAVLRVLGLGQLATVQTDHRVLNRARWSSRKASQILFGLLVTAFAPHGPLVVGLDETVERRRGRKISAAGIYRDPLRSSRSHFVKYAGCAGCVPCSWSRSPGQGGHGRCRSSPSLLPRSARPPDDGDATTADNLGTADDSAALSLDARPPPLCGRRPILFQLMERHSVGAQPNCLQATGDQAVMAVPPLCLGALRT
jgi:hypothetical protein